MSKGLNKNFIGIDFSKKTFDATILHKGNLNDNGIHEQFENNKTGINKFERWVKHEVGQDAQATTLFCGENTGIYSKLTSNILHKRGYTISSSFLNSKVLNSLFANVVFTDGLLLFSVC